MTSIPSPAWPFNLISFDCLFTVILLWEVEDTYIQKSPTRFPPPLPYLSAGPLPADVTETLPVNSTMPR